MANTRKKAEAASPVETVPMGCDCKDCWQKRAQIMELALAMTMFAYDIRLKVWRHHQSMIEVKRGLEFANIMVAGLFDELKREGNLHSV